MRAAAEEQKFRKPLAFRCCRTRMAGPLSACGPLSWECNYTPFGLCRNRRGSQNPSRAAFLVLNCWIEYRSRIACEMCPAISLETWAYRRVAEYFVMA